MLLWEGDGLSIWYKRLEAGTFAQPAGEGEAIRLSATQLTLILGGIDLQDTRGRKRYRRTA